MLSRAAFPQAKQLLAAIYGLSSNWQVDFAPIGESILWMVDERIAYSPRCPNSHRLTKTRTDLLRGPPYQPNQTQLAVQILHSQFQTLGIDGFDSLECRLDCGNIEKRFGIYYIASMVEGGFLVML
jgi:hypothetical protein